MAELLTLVIIVWIVGGCIWFVVSLADWQVSREFPSLHDDDEMRDKALRVLKTPIWPMVMLGMAGRTIGELWKDVLR